MTTKNKNLIKDIMNNFRDEDEEIDDNNNNSYNNDNNFNSKYEQYYDNNTGNEQYYNANNFENNNDYNNDENEDDNNNNIDDDIENSENSSYNNDNSPSTPKLAIKNNLIEKNNNNNLNNKTKTYVTYDKEGNKIITKEETKIFTNIEYIKTNKNNNNNNNYNDDIEDQRKKKKKKEELEKKKKEMQRQLDQQNKKHLNINSVKLNNNNNNNNYNNNNYNYNYNNNNNIIENLNILKSELQSDKYAITNENFDQIHFDMNNNNNKTYSNVTFDINNNNNKIKKKNSIQQQKSNIKDYFQPALYNDTNMNNYKKSSRSKSKNHIEDELYEDAINRRKKREKIDLNIEMDIKLNASRTNMIDESIKKVIKKNEKNIDNSVNYFCDKDGFIDYFNIAQILTDLNIFIELLKVVNKNSKNSNDKYRIITTLKEFKSQINLINSKEERKEKELIFLEQLWFTFNPNLLKNNNNNKNDKNNNNNNNIKIKKEIFSRFLKIIFSPIETSLNELESILNRFIQAAFFNNNNSNELSNSSSNNISPSSNSITKSNIFSPITEKEISFQDIWTLKTLIKKFFELKKNNLAYTKTKNLKIDGKQYIQDKEKEYTFQPKINNNNNNSFIKNKNFDDKIKSYNEREELKKRALEVLKKEALNAEMDECTFTPKINQNYHYNNIIYDNEKEEKVYDKLYKYAKTKQDKLKEKIKQNEEEKKQIEDKEITSKPNLNKADLDKTFNQINYDDKLKPKGFQKYVEKTRKGIIENFRKKFIKEKNPCGENYDKIKHMNIQPFNITDIRKYNEKKIKDLCNKTNTELEDDNSDSSENNDYCNLQIKVPNGREIIIKLYKKSEADKIAENLCKIYCLKDDIRDKLKRVIEEKKREVFDYEDDDEEEEESYEN